MKHQNQKEAKQLNVRKGNPLRQFYAQQTSERDTQHHSLPTLDWWTIGKNKQTHQEHHLYILYIFGHTNIRGLFRG